MTLRELALRLRSPITFTGKLHAPDGIFEFPWVCEMGNAYRESTGWSGTYHTHYRGYGKTTAQAWEALAKELRGETVLFQSITGKWGQTFTVPSDLVAENAP